MSFSGEFIAGWNAGIISPLGGICDARHSFSLSISFFTKVPSCDRKLLLDQQLATMSYIPT